MPENPTDPSQRPDVRTIRHLVRLMHRYDLTAIDLVEGQTQIRLRRRREAPPAVAAPSPISSVAGLPAAGTRAESALSSPAVSSGTVIESPMVGTFYSSSAPDAPPFVSVGSAVRAESIVCVIEAMKVFTDIPAGIAGTITEVLVKNGQSVEFGQPLFRVDPA
ncbi:MAG TPA: acetyl-CoA carboxylase biotin carboxyl carrier protein [Isosphaeraceae bacterium]|jgi:acetyl-CoA carboxylase biotin carboxyl carrier protein|nr:acetyl-CoA carboxylase biotin carboxyl carrier protein [Isosphaeraceae bacterium]